MLSTCLHLCTTSIPMHPGRRKLSHRGPCLFHLWFSTAGLNSKGLGQRPFPGAEPLTRALYWKRNMWFQWFSISPPIPLPPTHTHTTPLHHTQPHTPHTPPSHSPRQYPISQPLCLSLFSSFLFLFFYALSCPFFFFPLDNLSALLSHCHP